MTSTRFVLSCIAIAIVASAGCSGRVDTMDAGTHAADVGADTITADDGGHDAASGGSDAGHDAATITTPDAGHDAFVSTSDAGCAPPVCMPLPSTCHYDSSLDPCRCGMIVCDPYPTCSPACTRGAFCEFHEGDCGASGGGTCTTPPAVCPGLVDPVCGCDGMTYSNACEAQAASQSIVYHGACETPTDCRSTGCRTGQSCMACRGTGYVCLDTGTVC
jgi:hypothetical protein